MVTVTAHRLRLAILQNICDLFRLIEHIDWHNDSATAQDGVVRDDELGDVRHEQCNPVPRHNSAQRQSIRGSLDPDIEVRIRNRLVREDERGLRTVALGDIAYEFSEGCRIDLHGFRFPTVLFSTLE